MRKKKRKEKKIEDTDCRILDTTWRNFVNNVVFSQKKFTIAYCDFQTVSILCAALACANAVVLSGYNGHGLSYSDYSDVADEYIGSTGYKVLPTVAVPVHSVSAAPLHVDASLDHELHDYKHVEQEHDYYVSTSLLCFHKRCIDIHTLLGYCTRETMQRFFVKIPRCFVHLLRDFFERFFKTFYKLF